MSALQSPNKAISCKWNYADYVKNETITFESGYEYKIWKLQFMYKQSPKIDYKLLYRISVSEISSSLIIIIVIIMNM